MQHPTKLPYKVAVEIDCDCQELLDAIGLDYEVSEDDDTQNVVELEYDTRRVHGRSNELADGGRLTAQYLTNRT